MFSFAVSDDLIKDCLSILYNTCICVSNSLCSSKYFHFTMRLNLFCVRLKIFWSIKTKITSWVFNIPGDKAFTAFCTLWWVAKSLAAFREHFFTNHCRNTWILSKIVVCYGHLIYLFPAQLCSYKKPRVLLGVNVLLCWKCHMLYLELLLFSYI